MSEGKPISPPEGMEPLTRMEVVVSYVLRAGVIVSAAIVLVGILLFAARQETGYAKVTPHHLPGILAYHRTSGPGFFPTSLASVARGAAEGKPYAVICFGLLVLIATPVVRVALSVFFFLVQGDWLYVGITLFVLAVLLLSLFTGIG
jgi:uncharacterized membrane protein